ncbi:MAG TPA: DoxX family protein [Tepidisphaeraceae bacterium]|nr:DoxX family protein [Tepidisphaeraceae bacterium]
MPESMIERDAGANAFQANDRPVSSSAFWGGWVISGLPAAFLLMDGVMKLFKPKPVIEGTVQLGFPESVIVPLGITLICCVVLYLIPRTAVLGAILLTGYLGGAVASQVRVGHPLFADILAPVYVAIFIWTGLCLRDRRVRALAPLRSLPKGR